MINVVGIDDLMGHLFTLNQDTIAQNYRDYPHTALYDKTQGSTKARYQHRAVS